MKWIIVLLAILCCFLLSNASGSYETGPSYGVSHSSYPAAPAHGHGHGWGNGHGAGSYYHYHVPLVGQHQHYQPPQQQNNDHHLYYFLPLLLLAALPLLLLPLLPLLLLPLGLSLLALLMPMMMMMMMMMMPGGMMMMMRNHEPNRHGSGDARNFGHLLYHDVNSLFSRYARSLDLDHCPERLACDAGNFLLPTSNGTEFGTARSLLDFVEQYIPKGKTRRFIRNCKQAFWMGSKTGNCMEFSCRPAFKIPAETPVVNSPPTNFANGTDANSGAAYQAYAQDKNAVYGDYYNQLSSPHYYGSTMNKYGGPFKYYSSLQGSSGSVSPTGFKPVKTKKVQVVKVLGSGDKNSVKLDNM